MSGERTPRGQSNVSVTGWVGSTSNASRKTSKYYISPPITTTSQRISAASKAEIWRIGGAGACVIADHRYSR